MSSTKSAHLIEPYGGSLVVLIVPMPYARDNPRSLQRYEHGFVVRRSHPVENTLHVELKRIITGEIKKVFAICLEFVAGTQVQLRGGLGTEDAVPEECDRETLNDS